MYLHNTAPKPPLLPAPRFLRWTCSTVLPIPCSRASVPIPLPLWYNRWELPPLTTLCTNIPPALPLFATGESLAGMTGVGRAEPLPAPFILARKTLFALSPLLLPLWSLPAPLALCPGMDFPGRGPMVVAWREQQIFKLGGRFSFLCSLHPVGLSTNLFLAL